MKKFYPYLFVIITITNSVTFLSAQSIEELNRFKYINVPPLEYIVQDKRGNPHPVFDIYGIREIVKQILQSIGIIVLENNEADLETLRDNCEIGHCYIAQNSNLDPNIYDEIVIYFSDCNYQTVYQCGAKVTSLVAKKATASIPLGISVMQQATREALNEFQQFNYNYDTLNPIAKTEFTLCKLDKKEIKEYLKDESNELDLIEGIYESLDVDFYYLKIAVVKNADRFDLIVVESDNITWKSGQIRGQVKPVEVDQYIGNWSYTNNEEFGLEIEKGKLSKVLNFKFIDRKMNEYFEIEFKKKIP